MIPKEIALTQLLVIRAGARILQGSPKGGRDGAIALHQIVEATEVLEQYINPARSPVDPFFTTDVPIPFVPTDPPAYDDLPPVIELSEHRHRNYEVVCVDHGHVGYASTHRAACALDEVHAVTCDATTTVETIHPLEEP